MTHPLGLLFKFPRRVVRLCDISGTFKTNKNREFYQNSVTNNFKFLSGKHEIANVMDDKLMAIQLFIES